jgi:16S rRNA (adenine1518-N6/adenine1519-N6)-dimethyltransferase
METDNSSEIFDVVDQRDNVIGQATRARCHSEKLIHRCAYIVLFTSARKMLLFKRSSNVDKYPGFYGIIAEHVKAGESYEAAANRGLKEELGINLRLDYETKIPMFSEQEKEMGVVFKGIYDGTFNLDTRELEKAEFYPFEEVMEKFHKKEIEVTPGTSFVLNYLATSR